MSQRSWSPSTPVKHLKKASLEEQFTSILSHITKVQSPEEQPYVKKNEAGQRVRPGAEAVKVHQHPIRRRKKGRAQKSSHLWRKTKLASVYVQKHKRSRSTSILSDVAEGQSPEEQPGGQKGEAGQRVRPGVEEVVVHQQQEQQLLHLVDGQPHHRQQPFLGVLPGGVGHRRHTQQAHRGDEQQGHLLDCPHNSENKGGGTVLVLVLWSLVRGMYRVGGLTLSLPQNVYSWCWVLQKGCLKMELAAKQKHSLCKICCMWKWKKKYNFNFRAGPDAVSYNHTESTLPWMSYDAPWAVKGLNNTNDQNTQKIQKNPYSKGTLPPPKTKTKHTMYRFLGYTPFFRQQLIIWLSDGPFLDLENMSIRLLMFMFFVAKSYYYIIAE